jgi:acyl-coenzyme A thioesterase PaaI-like protein
MVDAVPDLRHVVSDYFRLERWEIEPPRGDGAPSAFGGRAPVDPHLRGPAGGMRTGGLLTVADSLGGFASGVAVLPQWIVTTSMLASVFRPAHVGPLVLEARILRSGRNSVVTAVDVTDEGDRGAAVAHVVMTCAVLDPGTMDLGFRRPFSFPVPPPTPDAPGPEEFFRIEPGVGPVTRLELVDHIRNPWGILHGGAVAMLADVAAGRAVEAVEADRAAGRAAGTNTVPSGPWASADTVLHYLRPARVGPVEARCQVLGGPVGRRLVRVAIHDVGADDRLVAAGSVTVVDEGSDR